jgi:hypothetical protein
MFRPPPPKVPTISDLARGLPEAKKLLRQISLEKIAGKDDKSFGRRGEVCAKFFGKKILNLPCSVRD